MSVFKSQPLPPIESASADPLDVSERLTVLSRRVRLDYDEMPGLSVTVRQASRLWGISPHDSYRVLTSLVEIGYLRKSTSGYVRTFETLALHSRHVN
jgi:hypothetical protein